LTLQEKSSIFWLIKKKKKMFYIKNTAHFYILPTLGGSPFFSYRAVRAFAVKRGQPAFFA
jgi:hypothetical protein